MKKFTTKTTIIDNKQWHEIVIPFDSDNERDVMGMEIFFEYYNAWLLESSTLPYLSMIQFNLSNDDLWVKFDCNGIETVLHAIASIHGINFVFGTHDKKIVHDHDTNCHGYFDQIMHDLKKFKMDEFFEFRNCVEYCKPSKFYPYGFSICRMTYTIKNIKFNDND